MKNLKKVLSLALAFAMVLGLCVTGMAAQDVTTLADWETVTDKDSAILLNAFEIMQGDENGFRPNDLVKRSEAAKMISVALWGGVDNVALYASGNVGGYTDVELGAWYMGYVNYLTVTGVMTGKGEGEFDPDGEVTGYELLKMCLVALGYSAETEKLTGLGWDLRTMAIATQRGFNPALTTGTDVSDWNAALNRMNSATIIANMIWRDTVVYDDGVIKTNGTFATQVLGLTPVKGQLVSNAYTTLAGTTVPPISTTARGYAGQNAYVSYNNNTYAVALDSTIYDVGKPVEVYIVGNKIHSVSLITGTEVEPSFYNSTLTNGDIAANGAPAVTYYLDDATVAGPTAYGSFSGSTSSVFTANSDVEVKWFDTNGDGYIDLVKGYSFSVQQMPKVVTDSNGNTWYDWNNNGAANAWYTGGTDYETTSYAFGAAAEEYVALGSTLTTAFGAPYWYGYALGSIEGEITRIATDKSTVYVNGVAVKNITETGDANLVYDKDGTFYTWANGTLAKFVPTTPTSVDPVYAVVYDAGYEAWGSTTAMSGSTGVVVEVKAILPDGTNGTFEVANIIEGGKTYAMAKQDETKITNATSMVATDTSTGGSQLFSVSGSTINGGVLGTTATTGGASMLVEYTLNEDGTINLNLSNIITATFTGTITKGTALVDGKYVTSKTVTYIEDSNGKWTVATGLTIPSSNGNATGTYVPVKYLETVNAGYGYIMLENANYTPAGASATTAIFYALSDAEQIGVDANAGNAPVYEVTMFNSKTDKVETVETYTPVAKGDIYDTLLNGAYTNTSGIAGVAGDYIAAVGEGVLNIAGTIHQINEKTLFVYIKGEDSAVITAADLTVQTAPSTGFKVVVADTTTPSPDGILDVVIVLG